MNENAKKWVDALRSGEYQQAQAILRNKHGHMCCLGVACDLYRKEFGGYWNGGLFKIHDGEEVGGYLNEDIRRWVGLMTYTGRFQDGGSLAGRSLAGRNDDGASFDEIADIIESEPEGLFA